MLHDSPAVAGPQGVGRIHGQSGEDPARGILAGRERIRQWARPACESGARGCPGTRRKPSGGIVLFIVRLTSGTYLAFCNEVVKWHDWTDCHWPRSCEVLRWFPQQYLCKRSHQTQTHLRV